MVEREDEIMVMPSKCPFCGEMVGDAEIHDCPASFSGAVREFGKATREFKDVLIDEVIKTLWKLKG